MAVGSGRVTTLNPSAVCSGRKITPIPREWDNTDDREAAAFAVRTRWTHIRVPDLGYPPNADGTVGGGPYPPSRINEFDTGSRHPTYPGSGGSGSSGDGDGDGNGNGG